MSKLLSNRLPRTRKLPLFNLLGRSSSVSSGGCQVAGPNFCVSVKIGGKSVNLLGGGLLARREMPFEIWFWGSLGGFDV